MKQKLAFLVFASALAAGGADGVLPVSVWYGGGKARAPMLERNPRARKEQWRQDIRKIRDLGFRTFRCWVD
jgi:beta-galactosidase